MRAATSISRSKRPLRAWGVAIGPCRLVEGDIAAGVLAAPLGFAADGSTYNLLSPLPLDSEPSVALASTWLRTIAGGSAARPPCGGAARDSGAR